MKLNLLERLVALNLLPDKGDYTTLRIVDDLRRNLAPTEKEHKEMEINTREDGNITWNTEKGAVEVEIEMGEKATDIIVDALKKIHDKKELTKDHMSLYEKFVLQKV